MYYKIIATKSFFADLYDGMNIDVLNIPYGTVFTAPDQSKYRADCPRYMVSNSCFHFAQGAFDTMLWHTKLGHHLLVDASIYQIQPLTKVKKQRCKDDTGIYQCGAHEIKILEKQNINDMYEQAIQEYYTDSKRYKNFKIDIDWWKKHQPTAFFLYKYYR